jgi:hypothetical protein
LAVQVIVGLIGLGSGCAPTLPRVTYTGLGAADPVRDQQATSAVYDQDVRRRLTREPVTVMMDSVPPGLRLNAIGVDDSGPAFNGIQVQPGYQHRVVGRFRMGGTAGTLFSEYRQPWRKALCYPQEPLAVATVFLWRFLVPLYYPCFTGTPTRADLVGDIKALAAAAGGDLVVGRYLWPREDQAAGAWGFIIRMDPRLRDQRPIAGPAAAPAAAPPPSPSPSPPPEAGRVGEM